ncbi:MAG TPA: hypothetical protein VGR28_10080, partial [Candidatus Thermoplasmatota archaeon]|nr:hypothetical protein [Candidatus Thermoplasmatota archaeon]
MTVSEMQVAIYGAVVMATGLVGLVVLAANPRRTWNQWLAFYLLLVCGNFATQFIAGLFGIAYEAGRLSGAAFAAEKHFLERFGALFLIFDPAVLAYFACLYPRRGGLAERRWGLPLLAGAVLGFLALELGLVSLTRARPLDPVRLGFFVYLAVCYVYAAWRLLRSYLAEPSAVMALQLRVVALGMVVVAFPRAAFWLDDTSPDLGPIFDPLGPGGGGWFYLASLATRLVTLWGLYLAARAMVQRHPEEARRREALQLLRLAGLVFAVFTAMWTVQRGALALQYGPGWLAPAPVQTLSAFFELMTYAVRWFVFTAAILYGFVRYQVLAVDARALPAAGTFVAGLGGFVLVGLGGAALGPWAGAALASLVVVVLAVAYRNLARRARGARSDAYLRERGLEVYRAALAAAAAGGGRAPEAERRELARLRARLGISDREHEALLAIAQAEEAREQGPVLLGRYEVLRRLGSGGYATVYL